MKIQTITIVTVVFTAAIAGIFGIPRPRHRHGNPFFNIYDPDFQLDILQQEKATTGKVFRVTAPDGSEVVKYVCAPDDAAIALFTMRNKFGGSSLRAAVASARDIQSRNYLGVIAANGPVKVLALKRGFASKPKVVNVEIANGGVTGRRRSVIQMTEIADPVRDISPPTGVAAIEAEKVATAKLNQDRTFVIVTCHEPLPPNEVDSAIVEDSTYLPFIPARRPLGFWPLPNTAAVSIDAVKVRIDRYHRDSKVVVLTYKGAKVVKVNGRNFVSLPTLETLGKIEGGPILAGNKVPFENGARHLQAPPSNQVIELKWKYIFKPGETVDPAKNIQPPVIEWLSVSPPVKELGLDSLRVSLRDALVRGQVMRGFSEIVRSPERAIFPQKSDIPVMKFRVRISHFQKLFSKTVILPLHQ